MPMHESPASRLLARPEAIVVMGNRPAPSRPWLTIGAAVAFVIMGTALSPSRAEAFDFRVGSSSSGYIRTGNSTSARQFEANEALTVQKTAAGRIVGIRPAEIQPRQGLSTGTALGALVGGVIGNRFGKGFSRVLATGAGAVAGGAIGNRVSDSAGKHEAVELFIEPDADAGAWSLDPRAPRGRQQVLGGTISVVQDSDISYQVGDAVWVVGSGSRIRIVPREEAPAADFGSDSPESGMADRLQQRRGASQDLDDYPPPRPRP